MSSTHDATFYVQIEPDFYIGPSGKVRAIKAVRITQQRPDSPKPNTVTAKLTVRVPDAAFRPLAPEAVIVVPDDMLAVNEPLEVEAGDPA